MLEILIIRDSNRKNEIKTLFSIKLNDQPTLNLENAAKNGMQLSGS